MAKRKRKKITHHINLPNIGILIIGVAILLAIFVIRPTFKYQDTLHIQSTDGSVNLTIPSESLPSDMEQKKLTVNRVETPSAFTDRLVSYRIGPEGVTLSKPASISITLDINKYDLLDDDNKSIKVPYVIHSSETGNIKPLESLNVKIDLLAAKMTISANIDSFSYISINTQTPLQISFATSNLNDTFNVGDNFDVEAIFTSNIDQSEKFIYSYQTGDGIVSYETFLEKEEISILAGEILSPGYISPREVENLPAIATIRTGIDESVVQTTTLTCEDSGPKEYIEFTQDIEYSAHINPNLIPTKKEILFSDGRLESLEMSLEELKGGYTSIYVSLSLEVFCNPNNIDVTMLIHEGQQFPAIQFDSKGTDLCKTDHYHPISDGSAYNREKQLVVDPAPQECGFGTLASTEIEVVPVPRSEAQELSDFLVENGKPPLPLL